MSEIIHGNCIEVLKRLDENSIDAIITDPPYELGFMGKSWDKSGIAFSSEVWAECLRVLKPGGHMLAFGGSRTFHRIAVAIEDAGFELRDTVMWVYGSGFPKSHNISKGIDKINGELGRLLKFVNWMRTTGLTANQINTIINKSDIGSHYLRLDQPAIPTSDLWEKLRPHIKVEIPKWIDELVERTEAEREIIGKHPNPSHSSSVVFDNSGSKLHADDVFITAPATPEAQMWEGWGTALKPAFEPIILARKPISEKNIAENVLKWGTGGINIDDCRINVADNEKKHFERMWDREQSVSTGRGPGIMKPLRKAIKLNNYVPSGRWPANFFHDGSEEVLELFPETNSNSPARFFYCAKASRKERGENNNHPTVKPLALMQYLVRLVTPPNGIVLDPFSGSGSTLIAATREGFKYIGIELNEEYIEIAEKRLQAEQPLFEYSKT